MSNITKASGINSLWLGVTSVAAGAAAAAMHGNLIILPLTLCLLFGLCAQFSINFLHRYNNERFHFGENEADGISFSSSPFSTQSVLREATFGAILVTAMIGLSIIIMGGWFMIVFGAALTLLALILNVGRHPLCRTPWGVGLSALAYGPVGAMAVCFLQSQRESVNDFTWFDLGPALYIGLAAGFLIGNWQIVYNYSQYDNDRRNNKRTLSVTIGLSRSRFMIILNSVCAIAVILMMSLAEYREYWCWTTAIPVLALPFYIYITQALKKADTDGFHRLTTLAGVVMFSVMVGLFVVFCFTGVPLDTHLTLFGS